MKELEAALLMSSDGPDLKMAAASSPTLAKLKSICKDECQNIPKSRGANVVAS